MPKKSYRRRNRGGDEEVPKKPDQILEEIKKEEVTQRLRDEHGRFTPKEVLIEKPIEEVQAAPPPPAENTLKEEIPPSAPPPQEDTWLSPPKEPIPPPAPAPQEDNWFSPKKPTEPVMEEEVMEEEVVIPEQKPSIFTLGFIIALIFSVISLILLSIGIYILARKPTYPSETTGTVKTAKCVNNNCILVIEFTPEGAKDKLTSNELQISGNYNKGDSVKINYNPDNPTTFGVNLISPKVFGWSFIGISVLLLLIIWGLYYFTRRQSS